MTAGAPAGTAPASPTPRVLYVHDDLTAEVRRSHGEAATRAARRLLALVARDRARVHVLTLEAQVQSLAARGACLPFEVTIGIGAAGARVARAVHAWTGWFPRIARVEVAREENTHGGYDLATLDAGSLVEQLAWAARGAAGAAVAASIAVVDDTVFSGLTMRAVLSALPPGGLDRAQAFCLRGVAQSIVAIAALCPVTAGFAAPGRLLEDVSFINASGLVRRGAIRRAGAPPLAFYERPEWIRAWFPDCADDVIARCRALASLLEGAAGRRAC